MSEISREECISTISKWLGCNECDSEECLSSICYECKYNYYEDNFKTSLKQAISDMQKLEKIIQLYEPKPFGKGISREDRDREIEKILKGEQNEEQNN